MSDPIKSPTAQTTPPACALNNPNTVAAYRAWAALLVSVASARAAGLAILNLPRAVQGINLRQLKRDTRTVVEVLSTYDSLLEEGAPAAVALLVDDLQGGRLSAAVRSAYEVCARRDAET